MRLHRDGIEDVRAVLLPDAIAADGCGAVIGGAALVTWHSSHAAMHHQVYLNNSLAGATFDVEQRQLVVQLPTSFLSAVHVEVVAVEPEDAHLDLSDELDPLPAGGRVRLVLLRSQALPPKAHFNVYFDNGSGHIDYDAPLNASPISVWPCPQDKAGFAMAAFGTDDFGYDSAACVGFGRGRLGEGPFGMDADAIEWISPPLPLGRYRFGVKIVDACGNGSVAGETDPIAVIPPPQPAAALCVASFNPQTNELVLRISDQ
ncbi:MAG: hypothetical protein ABFE01_00985 [Phycisphaerales bacterium]|jgi:hypothetical protein